MEKTRGGIMKHFIFPIIVCLQSCTALPTLFDDAEKIADDTAVKVEVSREAMQRDTDLKVTIEVVNKDEPIKN